MRVLLGMPVLDHIEPPAFVSCWRLRDAFPEHDFSVFTPEAAPFWVGRAMLAAATLTQGFDAWLSVDADMGFNPESVQRLFDADEEFAVCPGPRKSLPPQLATQLITLETGVKEIVCGLCLALIRRTVLERLLAQFPQTIIVNGVSYPNWFYPVTTAEGQFIEPDYAFQMRWLSCGGRIWKDPQPALAHRGKFFFPSPQAPSKLILPGHQDMSQLKH